MRRTGRPQWRPGRRRHGRSHPPATRQRWWGPTHTASPASAPPSAPGSCSHRAQAQGWDVGYSAWRAMPRSPQRRPQEPRVCIHSCTDPGCAFRVLQTSIYRGRYGYATISGMWLKRGKSQDALFARTPTLVSLCYRQEELCVPHVVGADMLRLTATLTLILTEHEEELEYCKAHRKRPLLKSSTSRRGEPSC